MKKIQTIKSLQERLVSKLKGWWQYDRIFSKGWNEYYNPFYHWWLARKYFKSPKCHIMAGRNVWFFGLPIRKDCWNRFIDIKLSALGWKDKYASPRHEWDPYICISFFRKYKIVFLFSYGDNSTEDLATWEAILHILYYNFKLDENLVYSSIWCRTEYEYFRDENGNIKTDETGAQMIDWKNSKKIPVSDIRKSMTPEYYNQFKDLDLYKYVNKNDKD